MPRPAHTRLTFSGVFGGTTTPTEIWAFNLNAPPNLASSGTQGGLVALATALDGAYNTHLKPLFPPDVVLTRVRAAAVGVDGLVDKRADGSYVQGDYATALSGTGSLAAGARKPLQTALCVSLITGRAGATGKGRFFLPWPAAGDVGVDYLVSASTVGTWTTSCKSFVNAVNAALSSKVHVVSTKGYTSEVTGVRVGRAPDTMRSRRSALLEGYVTQTLA